MRKFILIFFITSSIFSQRISSNKISRLINKNPVFSRSHVAVAVQPLGSDKKIKGVMFSKYMTPASNTKLLTFLGAVQTFDSIPIINYSFFNKELHISSTGYPLLFHPKYPDDNLEEFLNSFKKVIYHHGQSDLPRFGSGWAWDDYPFYFSAQTSILPLFGNVALFIKNNNNKILAYPPLFKISDDRSLNNSIIRSESTNSFIVNSQKVLQRDSIYIPFKTSEKLTASLLNYGLDSNVINSTAPLLTYKVLYSKNSKRIYEAILKDSDNLISESLLLMISKELNDSFSTLEAINQLKKDWSSWIPDPLLWFDGSGLSRYTMMTPRTIVSVLQKIHNQIGLKGIQSYFSAGGKSGTIKEYYKKGETPFVYAKTGTLRNNHNLSGYIISRKGNWYVFSIMVNHFENPTKEIRLAIGDLLEYLYNRG